MFHKSLSGVRPRNVEFRACLYLLFRPPRGPHPIPLFPFFLFHPSPTPQLPTPRPSNILTYHLYITIYPSCLFVAEVLLKTWVHGPKAFCCDKNKLPWCLNIFDMLIVGLPRE